MTENDYTPRQEFANVRQIGKFDTPSPENYLGKQHSIEASMANHPAKGKKPAKVRTQLDPEEAVNIFRLSILFAGIIFFGIGIALWLTVALGLVAFGVMLWATALWIISHADRPTKDKE